MSINTETKNSPKKKEKKIMIDFVGFIRPPDGPSRMLGARSTYEQAEENLRAALAAEKPGARGCIEKLFIVREVKTESYGVK